MPDFRPIDMSLDDGDPAWPCRPCIAGDWSELPFPLIDAIRSQAARDENRGAPKLPDPIRRMRRVTLSFYPGWTLVEGLARYSTEMDGVFRLLVGPSECILIDGNSFVIHGVNKKHLDLSGGAATVDQYVRFFTSAVRGEDGPFRVVEGLVDIEDAEKIAPSDRDRGTALIKPLKRLKSSLIAVVDGLKGFPEAINAVFPQTVVQTCIVHLIRHSLEFVSWKDRKAVVPVLRAIYRAKDAEAGLAALDAFDAGYWGQRYPAITQSWRRNWQHVVPFFAYPESVRRIIYTTNAIEALNSKLRRAVRTRGHFPSDDAAMKLLYLVLNHAAEEWKRPPREWFEARTQFAVVFGERFVSQ